jgi:hypothetical protein
MRIVYPFTNKYTRSKGVDENYLLEKEAIKSEI